MTTELGAMIAYRPWGNIRTESQAVRCHRSDKSVGVLLADLDAFKIVNDTHEHGTGDEFLIISEDLNTTSEVEAIANRTDAAPGVSFIISGVDIDMTASVGNVFDLKWQSPSRICPRPLMSQQGMLAW